MHYIVDYPALEIKNLDIVKLLLNVSTYHHPDNIKLPKGYRPPHLAIASMFWKSWLLILVLVAYNPTTFGKLCFLFLCLHVLIVSLTSKIVLI